MTLSRLLVAPAALAGEPDPITMVAARAAAERRFDTPGETELVVLTLEGDLASQHAVEGELAREGLDRAVLGREAFVERVRETEARRREQLVECLAAEGINVLADAGRTATEAGVHAATVAFVRLYDAGLLERVERVVDVCSRCQTVVEPTDALLVSTDVIRLTLVLDDGVGGPSVSVDAVELELLPGVVAVAVPPSHPAVGASVRVPLARDIPVVVDDDAEEPWLVVPAHSNGALEFARRINLTAPVPVLDRDGVVTAEGALAGLARFAARAAATDLVTAEGVVEKIAEATAEQARCGRCSTSLVPIIGWHWFLRTADLEVAAADAVRGGDVVVEDLEARDRFVDRAERADSWCLSHQVWAGDAVPASRCLDCGQIAVTTDLSSSCGKCMGELGSTDDVLDARFVAALWPLAHAGWPLDERAVADAAPNTIVFAGPNDVTGFALPVAALGLRLAGVVPFGELVCVR